MGGRRQVLVNIKTKFRYKHHLLTKLDTQPRTTNRANINAPKESEEDLHSSRCHKIYDNSNKLHEQFAGQERR